MTEWLSVLAAVLGIVLLILKQRRSSSIPRDVEDALNLEKEAQERSREQYHDVASGNYDDVSNRIRDSVDDIGAIIELRKKNPPNGG